jgi:hypothetical protein
MAGERNGSDQIDWLYDVIFHDVIFHGVIFHDMIFHDVIFHDMIFRDVTWHDTHAALQVTVVYASSSVTRQDKLS